jgi:CelD/BcsL family acetyltransferase involved in cellulose biosynthesis
MERFHLSPAEQIALDAPPDVSTAVLKGDEASTSLLNPSQHSSSVPAGPGVLFEIDPLGDQRWEAFVRDHPQASAFHQIGWLKALNVCYRYKPVALTFAAPGSPLESALVFCEVKSALTGNRLVSLPFSDHCEPLINHPDEIDLFVRTLTKKVREDSWKYLEIRPIDHPPSGRDLTVCHSYCFHVLGLQDSEEVIFRRLHKDSVQRKIRRAKREQLCYQEGTSEILLDHFYKLMIRTRRQKGLPPQPLKWFRALLTCMQGNAKIRVAYKDQTPVASILTISAGKRVVYKYGCSDSRFSNLGGTAMLFWRTIQEAKANGQKEFDMGRSNFDNPGLIIFKDRWGAQRRTLNYWHYPAGSASSRPESLIKHAKRMISIMPERPLVMIGNLLYRHIG